METQKKVFLGIILMLIVFLSGKFVWAIDGATEEVTQEIEDIKGVSGGTDDYTQEE